MRFPKLWRESLSFSIPMLMFAVVVIGIFIGMRNIPDTHLTATLAAGLFLFFALALLYISVGGTTQKKTRERQSGETKS